MASPPSSQFAVCTGARSVCSNRTASPNLASDDSVACCPLTVVTTTLLVFGSTRQLARPCNDDAPGFPRDGPDALPDNESSSARMASSSAALWRTTFASAPAFRTSATRALSVTATVSLPVAASNHEPPKSAPSLPRSVASRSTARSCCARRVVACAAVRPRSRCMAASTSSATADRPGAAAAADCTVTAAVATAAAVTRTRTNLFIP